MLLLRTYDYFVVFFSVFTACLYGLYSMANFERGCNSYHVRYFFMTLQTKHIFGFVYFWLQFVGFVVIGTFIIINHVI